MALEARRDHDGAVALRRLRVGGEPGGDQAIQYPRPVGARRSDDRVHPLQVAVARAAAPEAILGAAAGAVASARSGANRATCRWMRSPQMMMS